MSASTTQLSPPDVGEITGLEMFSKTKKLADEVWAVLHEDSNGLVRKKDGRFEIFVPCEFSKITAVFDDVKEDLSKVRFFVCQTVVSVGRGEKKLYDSELSDYVTMPCEIKESHSRIEIKEVEVLDLGLDQKFLIINRSSYLSACILPFGKLEATHLKIGSNP